MKRNIYMCVGAAGDWGGEEEEEGDGEGERGGEKEEKKKEAFFPTKIFVQKNA